jgi:hypothetical protein
VPQRGGIADEFRSFVSGGGFGRGDGGGSSQGGSYAFHSSPTLNFHGRAPSPDDVTDAVRRMNRTEARRFARELGMR